MRTAIPEPCEYFEKKNQDAQSDTFADGGIYAHHKCPAYQYAGMSSGTSETGGNKIRRIPVKKPTWRDLHDLKKAGQSYDDLLTVMTQRERDWKMITGIDRDGDFVAFDPEEIMTGE